MSVTVDIPAGTRPLLILALATTAGHIQKVNITDNQPGGLNKTYQGSASGTVAELGRDVRDRAQAKSYQVTITSSSDNGVTFKPSRINNPVKFENGKHVQFSVFSDDAPSGGDADFDDTIVHFFYTNL